MNPGFLLAEDAAVKKRFSTIRVTDNRNTSRPVKVFFRYPESETEKEYPFITVENIGLNHATNLQHSEQYYYFDTSVESTNLDVNTFNYFPSETDRSGLLEELGTSEYLSVESFVPVDLTYQIATYARSALHDRQLTSQLLRYVIPFRRGFIDVPEDGTIRRFDLLSWSNADHLDQEAGYRKRIFRKIYTLRMTAEIPTTMPVPVGKASEIVGTIKSNDLQTGNNPPNQVPITTFSEAF
jgi:hypothetical protein